MRIHLIKKRTIEEYVQKHPSDQRSFERWSALVRSADWNEPTDIKTTFPSADILGRGTQRVIFNIGGNDHRMICSYQFGPRRVHLFVKWIGPHAAYDKLCQKGEQFKVDHY